MSNKLLDEYSAYFASAINQNDVAMTSYYGNLVLQEMDKIIAEQKAMVTEAFKNGDYEKTREYNKKSAESIQQRNKFEQSYKKFIDVCPNKTICPNCRGYMQKVGERTGGFSGGKAVAGAVIAGPLGIAAGALGRKIEIFQCTSCGYTIEK